MSRSQFELKMNLENIQRVDPFAKDIIVHSASHVAFYVFCEENQWEKTNLEGSFFIYNRTTEPQYSIFITNRLRTNFVIQPVTTSMNFQSAPPFLLYRNDEMKKLGLWFSNTLECNHIGEIINGFINQNEIAENKILRKSASSSKDTMDSFEAAKAALANLPFMKGFLQNESLSSSNSSLNDFLISPNLSIEAEISSIDYPDKDATLESFIRPVARITPSSKPGLWLPTMFMSSSTRISENQQQQQRELDQPILDKAKPLTQVQMMEAMSYLIKNDVGFGKKLHEAYLMSQEFTSK